LKETGKTTHAPFGGHKFWAVSAVHAEYVCIDPVCPVFPPKEVDSMTVMLRIVLIVMSIFNCVWVLLRIRKAQVKIEDTVFWILFSGLLILLSLFPEIAEIGARTLGIQSQVNFLFLTILYVLIVKIFRMTVRISILESKLAKLVQEYAIKEIKEQSSERCID